MLTASVAQQRTSWTCNPEVTKISEFKSVANPHDVHMVKDEGCTRNLHRVGCLILNIMSRIALKNTINGSQILSNDAGRERIVLNNSCNL